MHVGHQVGLRQVQLVERAVQEHAARVQHRAHRTVADEHPAFELLEKWRFAHDRLHGGRLIRRRSPSRTCTTWTRRVDHQIRTRDEIEPHRSTPCAPASVNRWWWPNRCRRGLHRRQHLVDRASSPHPCRVARRVRADEVGPGCLVGHEDVDSSSAWHATTSSRTKWRRLSACSVAAACPWSGAADRLPACRTRSGRMCRRARQPAGRRGRAAGRSRESAGCLGSVSAGDRVEPVVVAFDEVHAARRTVRSGRRRRRRRRRTARLDIGVRGLDARGRRELAVDVAERADHGQPRQDLAVAAGTSRSVLSQMKSLLL